MYSDLYHIDRFEDYVENIQEKLDLVKTLLFYLTRTFNDIDAKQERNIVAIVK